MEKDKTAVEQFLSGTEESLFEKPSDPFETPLHSEAEPTEEKPLPFHKDPKIQKFIEKEISKRLTREETPRRETETVDDFKEVIDSFSTIIGNDTPEKVKALDALKRSLVSLDSKAVTRAEERIEEIRSQEDAADREAEEELYDAFETIEDNYDVDLTSQRGSKLRSEFVTFVERIAPKDRNGNVIDYPDMNSAWETFSEIKKSTAQPSRAKELANRSMSRSTTATPTQAKKIDWQAVDEYMDSLK